MLNPTTCSFCDNAATHRLFVWVTEELQTIDGGPIKRIDKSEYEDLINRLTYCDEHANEIFNIKESDHE